MIRKLAKNILNAICTVFFLFFFVLSPFIFLAKYLFFQCFFFVFLFVRIRISFVSFFRLSSVWNLKLCNCIHSNEEEKIEQISIVLVSFLSKLVIKHWLTFSKATRFSFFFFVSFFLFSCVHLKLVPPEWNPFFLAYFSLFVLSLKK